MSGYSSFASEAQHKLKGTRRVMFPVSYATAIPIDPAFQRDSRYGIPLAGYHCVSVIKIPHSINIRKSHVQEEINIASETIFNQLKRLLGNAYSTAQLLCCTRALLGSREVNATRNSSH